jgi:hypothetical protein
MPHRPGRFSPQTRKPRLSGAFLGVSDGTRTHDRLDHNQELYQLSYAHRGRVESSSGLDCVYCRQPRVSIVRISLSTACSPSR